MVNGSELDPQELLFPHVNGLAPVKLRLSVLSPKWCGVIQPDWDDGMPVWVDGLIMSIRRSKGNRSDLHKQAHFCQFWAGLLFLGKARAG